MPRFIIAWRTKCKLERVSPHFHSSTINDTAIIPFIRLYAVIFYCSKHRKCSSSLYSQPNMSVAPYHTLPMLYKRPLAISLRIPQCTQWKLQSDTDISPLRISIRLTDTAESTRESSALMKKRRRVCDRTLFQTVNLCRCNLRADDLLFTTIRCGFRGCTIWGLTSFNGWYLLSDI